MLQAAGTSPPFPGRSRQACRKRPGRRRCLGNQLVATLSGGFPDGDTGQDGPEHKRGSACRFLRGDITGRRRRPRRPDSEAGASVGGRPRRGRWRPHGRRAGPAGAGRVRVVWRRTSWPPHQATRMASMTSITSALQEPSNTRATLSSTHFRSQSLVRAPSCSSVRGPPEPTTVRLPPAWRRSRSRTHRCRIRQGCQHLHPGGPCRQQQVHRRRPHEGRLPAPPGRDRRARVRLSGLAPACPAIAGRRSMSMGNAFTAEATAAGGLFLDPIRQAARDAYPKTGSRAEGPPGGGHQPVSLLHPGRRGR